MLEPKGETTDSRDLLAIGPTLRRGRALGWSSSGGSRQVNIDGQRGAARMSHGIRLEIDADVADGVPSKTVMDVTENARTLKFSDFGFEVE